MRVTEIDVPVYPEAANANVEVAVAVPAAAVNVTVTPVFQFELFNVTLVGECAIAVLPERVIVTVTGLAGDAPRRTDAVPVVPPASVSVVGVALIESVAEP